MDDNFSDDTDAMEMSADDNSQASETASREQTGVKRKIAGSTEEATAMKRPKISPASGTARDLSSLLPPAIWQRTLMLLPPATLFRCLRVNKLFNRLLTTAKADITRGRGQQVVQMVDSETIWTLSRRVAYPSLPRPLEGLTEADMLRLVTAQSCQYCGKESTQPRATNALNGGPGMNGVRAIWQFRKALCGRCLKLLSLTDVELLQEKRELAPGALKKGLAPAFMSRDLHIVSEPTARQNPGQGISKIYFRSCINDLIYNFNDAKLLGEGAAEEWVKGLDDIGKEAVKDANRWHKWEAQLPVGTVLAVHMRYLDVVSFPPQDQRSRASHASNATTQFPLRIGNGPPSLPSLPPLPYAPLPYPVPQAIMDAVITRPSRDQRQVQEAQRLRREDIERRCKGLIPPIEPDVLQYSQAYNAAVLIAIPLTDAGWEILKPRIEHDREEAEKMHYERRQQLAALGAVVPNASQHGAYHQGRDLDREWELLRAPLRKKLSDFADDIINGKWLGGTELDEPSVPLFAAEVLTHVYDRYTDEVSARRSEDRGMQSPPALVLDDLKWIFDHKIRGAAEAVYREMFVCSGCYFELKETRWFAFEGLVQHYGAKHTTDFSKGNIVVHWQSAEWPRDPPYLIDLSKIRKPARKSAPKEQRPRSRGSVWKPTAPSQRRISYKQEQRTSHSQGSEDEAGSTQARPGFDPMVQRKQLVKDTIEVWKQLEGVKDLFDCVIVHTVLHHAKNRFEQLFQTELTLEIFTQALVNDSSLADFKTAHRLICRFCEPREHTGGPGYYQRLAQKQTYNLSKLLNHFQIVHLSQGNLPSSWTHFVDVPEKAVLVTLPMHDGMNDLQLRLIADAFPGIFPVPLPTVEELRAQNADTGLVARLLNRGGGQKGKKKGQNNGNAHSGNKNGEYDPRNPIINEKPKKATPNTPAAPVLDMSKYDTDARRPPSPPLVESSTIPMAPETERAIRSLESHFTIPSGREKLQPEPAAVALGLSSGVISEDMPDISAIIQALQRSATNSSAPNSTSHSRSGIASQSAQSNAGRPVSLTHQTPQPPPLSSYTTPSLAPHTSTAHTSTAAAPSYSRPEFVTNASSHSYASYSTPAPADAALSGSWQYAHNHSFAPQPQYATPPYQQMQYQTPQPQSAGQDLLASLTRNSLAFNHGSQSGSQPAHQSAGSYSNQPAHQSAGYYDPRQPSMPPNGQGMQQYAQPAQASDQSLQYRYEDEYGRPVAGIVQSQQQGAPQFFYDEYGRRINLIPMH